MTNEKNEPNKGINKPFSFVNDRFFWLSALVLAVFTALFYLPLWNNDFISTWDDNTTITDNIYIRSLSWPSIHWMWTTSLVGYYVPLTWMSLALDYQIGGLNPHVFHLTNLLLHIANTILVFGGCLQLLSFTRQGLGPEEQLEKKTVHVKAAFLTAILFALHPIHVESVPGPPSDGMCFTDFSIFRRFAFT